MRITQNTMFYNLQQQLQSNSSRLMQAQETVATQKKFNRLSDNPIDGARVLDLNSALANSQQYLKNIERVSSQANVQDSTLGQVNDMLGRAKELLLGEANQATSTSSTRESARIEIAHLTTQLVQAANTRFDGKYIFSGFATNTTAFTDAALTVTAGANTGGAAVTNQTVADPAQMIYHNYQIQFTGPGQYNILDTTSGTSVATGQSYTSGGTIQFNGMQITLTDSPTPPAAGDTFAINTAAPGIYQGDSQMQLIEVQPGTKVQQNIPGNMVFSGVGLNNGVDIFSIMNQVNTALRTNDRTAISNLLGQLDAARGQISSERSSVGGRINLLDTVKTRQTDVQTNMQVLSSDLEDIDVAEAMTQLNKQQNIYEATLAAGAKIVQPSLLDFLR